MDITNLLEQRIDIRKTIDTLQSDGFCFFEGLFDHATVKGLNHDFQNAFDKKPPGIKLTRHPPGRMASFDTSTCTPTSLPTIHSVFMSPHLKELSEAILTKDSVYSQMIKLTHEKIAMPITDVHFDTERSLKFLIYLLDTDVSNGAFAYARGSHVENTAYRAKFLSQGGHLQELQNCPAETESDTINLEPLVGPAGSMIIFDTDGWHSAGRLENDTKERRAIRLESKFAGQPSVYPKRYSLTWFRRSILCRRLKLKFFNPIPPFQIPGRGRTGRSTRRK